MKTELFLFFVLFFVCFSLFLFDGSQHLFEMKSYSLNCPNNGFFLVEAKGETDEVLKASCDGRPVSWLEPDFIALLAGVEKIHSADMLWKLNPDEKASLWWSKGH
jgi:hypothetical protein